MGVRCLVAAVAGAIVASVPLHSHHSFAAEFDASKPVTIVGTVTKVEWTNPHARVYVDAKDASGKIVNWDVELAGPNGLMRLGWRRDSLKVGESVTVAGYAARNAPHVANATSITTADGGKMFAGSSFDASSGR